ncbi:MAG TPA: SBBP repeat-containing protein, partial [Myxococcaceae bacterium]|nr:SBBP repeat-containing protein [Myxococcaceae bacterium]
NSIAAFIYDGPTAVEGTRLPYRGEGETYVALAKVRADGRLSWAKGFGAGEAGNGTIANTSISALAISPSGDVFIGGSLQGYNDVPAVLNLGGNPLGEGSFLAKFSADGSHQWSRNTRPGNGAEFTFSDFAVDPQGDLVALASFGPGGSQAMVIRYRGGDGEPQWTRLYGPVNDPNSSVTGRSLAVDGNGRIYWVGSFTGTVQMGTSRYTAPVTPLEDGIITSAPLVVALSNTGEVRWSRRLANHGEGLNTGVRDGHLLIGINGLVSAEPFALQGYIFDLDLSGNERWGRAVGIYARGVELGPFGEVVVAGPAPALELGVGQPPQEGAFAYVAKFRRVDGELLKVAAISAGLNDLSIGWQTGEVSAVGEFGGTSDLGFGPLKPQGESDGYLVRLSP